jgi:hypothetical protein
MISRITLSFEDHTLFSKILTHSKHSDKTVMGTKIVPRSMKRINIKIYKHHNSYFSDQIFPTIVSFAAINTI